MLDGCHGVVLAFCCSARVVFGPPRALSCKGYSDLPTPPPAGSGREESSALVTGLRDTKQWPTERGCSDKATSLNRAARHGCATEPAGSKPSGPSLGFQGRKTEPGPPGEPRRVSEALETERELVPLPLVGRG